MGALRIVVAASITSITSIVSMLTSTASAATSGTPPAARFDQPVERYGHFALGRPHEYARIVVESPPGIERSLTLPDDEVFEDLRPRLVRLTPDGEPMWLVIVSRRGVGARLALVGEGGPGLSLVAQSDPIGTPNRWLNPVGVADLDGDGRAEIAAVITPHIGGTLKVYRRQRERLVEIAALRGFSNHVYGSPELALSTPVATGEGTQLLVPDDRRRSLRRVALVGGALSELARCALPEPVTGPLSFGADGSVSVGLASGRRVDLAADCRR